jgi:hypothetical protein
MKRLIRNAHIGIAVGIAFLVIGFWPAHNSEGAVGALGITAFFMGLGVYLALNIRDERERKKRTHG